MAYSKNTYTADGSTTNFNITWSYMAQSEVKVKLDGVASTALPVVRPPTASMAVIEPSSGVLEGVNVCQPPMVSQYNLW